MSTLEDRYEIYVSCMKGSGEYIKTFDEWLNSQKNILSITKIVLDELVRSQYNNVSKEGEGLDCE